MKVAQILAAVTLAALPLYIVRCKDFSWCSSPVPFTLLDKGVARQGDKIYFHEKHIGFVTSGTAVPYWETAGTGLNIHLTEKSGIRSIGLALLDSCIWEEDIVYADIRGRKLKAVIVPYHLRSEAPPFSYPILYEKKKAAKEKYNLPSH